MKSLKSWSALVVIAGAFLALPAMARGANPSGEWQGFLLQNGERAAVDINLFEGSKWNSGWTGSFHSGATVVPLDHVQVTSSSVHFEVPGIGVFDGSVAGDTIEGAVSGAASGASFELLRKPDAGSDEDEDYLHNPPT
jgi:hypothetical protein